MAYLEITGLPLRVSESEFGPTVSLSLEQGKGLSVVSTDGVISRAVVDALTGYGDFFGEIHLNSLRIDQLPPRKRRIRLLGDSPGVVPRMTVKENLEFAVGGKSEADLQAFLAVQRELAESSLAGLENTKAQELDDATRTILAAARVLLQGCDLLIITGLPVPGWRGKVDQSWRPGHLIDTLLDLKSLLRRHRATWLSVLADPACIHILSDRVALFDRDVLVQEGTLRECLSAPQTRLVADYLAFPKMNYRPARIERDGPFVMLKTGRYAFRVSEFAKRQLASREGEAVVMGVKPEDLGLRPFETGDPTAMNLAKVLRVDSIPGAQVVRIDVEGDEWLAMAEPWRVVFSGQIVELRPNPDRIHVFHSSTGISLLE